MRILTSARKHGVTEQDIDYVFVYGEEFELPDPSPDGNLVCMYVGWGYDTEDLIEVKVEVLAEQDADQECIVVFHADIATRFWRKNFDKRVKCR